MEKAKQFAKGILSGLLLDVGLIGLFWLLSAWSMAPWLLVLVWVIAVLFVSGAGLTQSRWLLVGGFWLVHLALFTLGLLGLMSLLKAIYR